MASESSIGTMELTMKASGTIIKQKAWALFGMPKVMSTTVNSKMTWPTGSENTLTLMEASTKVSLEMMYKRAMVKKSGSMAQSTSEPISME
jgi:hypothetical protein